MKGLALPFTLLRFAATRPYLYHLTSRRNFEWLLRGRVMHSTAELLRASGNEQWLTRKRPETVTVTVDDRLIDLRDQQPLYSGKTLLENGWTFERLVQRLNERVFFWPGVIEGPVSSGRRHYERYAGESPVIMRVKTEDLLSANACATPLFCKYNSGSPRTTQGRGSPRGDNTFIECHRAAYSASNVVEVTFLHSVKLPQAIESSDKPSGPWKSH
jgi:hypothetical protein